MATDVARSAAHLRRDRRMWSLGFLVLLVVPSFILLSRWQFHRLDERRAENAVINSHRGSEPVAVGSVMTAGAPTSVITDEVAWTRVTALGHYDPAATRLVRKQPLNGANGFWVMTPLVLTDHSELVVNRGWIPAGPDARTSPNVPPPPSGAVTLVGRVRASVPAADRADDIPADQITAPDVVLVAPGASTFPGYVELETSSPPDAGTVALPLPDVDEGPHLSYALQWIAFAITAVVGFVIIVRSESRREDLATNGELG